MEFGIGYVEYLKRISHITQTRNSKPNLVLIYKGILIRQGDFLPTQNWVFYQISVKIILKNGFCIIKGIMNFQIKFN